MNTIYVSPTLKDSISKFLFNHNLLELVLAVYLGTVVQKFFTSIVDGFIMPLMILLVPNSKQTNFSDIVIPLFGVNIAAGDIIISTINLFIGFFVSFTFVTYFIYPYLKKDI